MIFKYYLIVIHFLCYVRYNKCFNIGGFNIKMPTINSYNPYCHIRECCNADWIYFDQAKLRNNLTERVYGQPLLQSVVDALDGHFNPYFRSTKALALSFHGMTGTGKNYVSKFLTESIYKNGAQSQYVHHFIGRMHFSEKSRANEYKENLYRWLKQNITNCPRQMFIFDEVDKMIPEVLNALKPLIDYRDNIDGADYTQSIFIFLSNTGADVINEHYHDLHISEGKNREDLTLADFESLIKKGIFNEEGGFHLCDAIKNNLIDHYIPFLPLEEKHIILCIKDEFKSRKIYSPLKEHIDQVTTYIEWGPDSSKKFAKTGCKGLGQKVALIVARYSKFYYMTKDEL